MEGSWMWRIFFPKALSLALVVGALALMAGPIQAREIPGQEVKNRTDRVMNSIKWSNNMDSLTARAKSERKLIFWLQLVGDLDDGL